MTRRHFTTGIVASSGLFAVPVEAPDSWIALDIDGNVRNIHWLEAAQPRSVGSLLKPFLALAYLSTHEKSPIINCTGAKAGCWHVQGHGRQDLISALANSCNVYFLQLTAGMNRAALDMACLSYGLFPPSRSWPASRLIGLGDGWPQIPASVARAFTSLARNTADLHVQEVLAGMLRCSQTGTAKEAGFPCFAKTGTAPCSHLAKGQGDGYAVGIYPTDSPRYVGLVMRHNTTGANAARNLKPLFSKLVGDSI